MKVYASDFETTVFKGQDSTEVWAASIVNLEAADEYESVDIFNSIGKWFEFLCQEAKSESVLVYMHNLRFDGSFVLNYIKRLRKWKEDSQAVYTSKKEYAGQVFEKSGAFKMKNNTYRYVVDDKGQWFTITLKVNFHTIEIRDSLKLLPFTIREIGEDFGLKHKKLEMQYEGMRYAGCNISDDERKYIASDTLVLKEALNFMYAEGHTSLTIGSCCMKEYKSQYTKKQWEELFPDLYKTEAGNFIHKTYKGGWCYVNPKYAGQEIHSQGVTADVNSLYPSVMVANRFPVGEGTYFQGDIPKEATENDRYYFVHIRTRFYLKEGMLPTIQIKYHPMYPQREWLETSDVVDMRLPKEERYKVENRFKFFTFRGETFPARPDLYLTMTDYELLKEHYTLEELEVVDGYYFETKAGLFDQYINKYADMKANSKGSRRQLAKLFANNLYGQFSKSPKTAYKMIFLNEKGCLSSYVNGGYDRTPGYIAIGSAITSYARKFTIDAAQANYEYFCYSDTDSIHCCCPADELKGAPEHPTKLGFWKYESEWDYAKFVRQKTYVEHVTAENRQSVDPHYSIKCAGMNDDVKGLFLHSILQDMSQEEYDQLDDDEKNFYDEKHSFEDFKVGLQIPGMLKAENIPGGVLLTKTVYTMREALLA